MLAEAASGASPMVCVVDDDTSVLRALARLLRSAGFRIETFSSPEAFLASAARDTAQCLVLDVRLGAQNGLSLYESLAAGGRRLPVIFMTAHDSATSRERALRSGAVAYLRKPFADQLLIEAIRRALAGGGE